MAPRTAPYRGAGAEKVKVRGNASSLDPDEAAALEAACEAAGISPDAATKAISAWIMKRAERGASARLTENLVFDLGDAKLRGFVAAALPAIGDALSTFVPPDTPFFALERDTVIDAFVIAFQAMQDAAVGASESHFFPLDQTFGDRIPFG